MEHCGVLSLAFTSNCATPGSPTLATTTLQEGGAFGLDEWQAIYFGLVTTGGTFRLEFDGEETGAITWSSTNATLAANILAALEALPNVGAGNVSGGVGSMIGGNGSIDVKFQGAMTATDVPQITIAENSLTGTARHVPVTGMTVTLRRGGDVVSSGVTDENGFINLPFYVTALDFEFTLDGGDSADYFIDDTYPLGLDCGDIGPLADFGLYPRMVPVTWSGIDDVPSTITIEGTDGTALGYSDSFEVPAFPGTTTVLMPGIEGLGDANTYEYSADPAFPDDPFRTLFLTSPCGEPVTVGAGTPHG